MKRYSQNSEQDTILEYFNNNGKGIKYIEIGGYSPFTFSNTRALYELGASGVIVEPSPECMASFENEYVNEPRIKLVQAAITDSDGIVEFYNSVGDAISTTDIAHKEKWEKGYSVNYNKITVKSISMDTFLKEHGQEVDFINIDVESTNWQLFNLIPDWFFNRLKMICIEHDGKNVEMETKLKSFGFRKILFNGENLIMVK